MKSKFNQIQDIELPNIFNMPTEALLTFDDYDLISRPSSPDGIPDLESRPMTPVEDAHTHYVPPPMISDLSELLEAPGTVDIDPEALRDEIINAGNYVDNFVSNVQRILNANLDTSDRCTLIAFVMHLYEGNRLRTIVLDGGLSYVTL